LTVAYLALCHNFCVSSPLGRTASLSVSLGWVAAALARRALHSDSGFVDLGQHRAMIGALADDFGIDSAEPGQRDLGKVVGHVDAVNPAGLVRVRLVVPGRRLPRCPEQTGAVAKASVQLTLQPDGGLAIHVSV